MIRRAPLAALALLACTDAATVAFEEALRDMPKSPEKKVISLDLADLYLTIGRWEQAVMLFRVNHDIPREFEVMMQRKQYDQALTLARLVRYPKGEGEALAYLGKRDEGLRVLERAGLHRERAELLYKMRRYPQAAQVYGLIPDNYWKARCLERARKSAEARQAYEDAREGVMFDLREEVLPKVKHARKAFDRAREGVTREQARIKLAEANGEAAAAYEKLAVIYARTKRPKADQLFDNAVRFVQRQIDGLLDEQGGVQDAFGALKVDKLKLRERQETIRRLKARLLGG
jgi:tetratricopeptide (TPR) repeat protein